MAEPFLAEIKILGFSFAPRGWAFCDGQLLPINQNQALFSLLGTTYGGDGRTTFALPDLRGRAPVHEGDGLRLGEKSGSETHFLSMAELPQHTHTLHALTSDAVSGQPEGNLLAYAEEEVYASPSAGAMEALANTSVTLAGGGQAHNNMQPYLVLNFCIALQGLFPSRN